jgi:hypothetical protein
MDSVKSKHCEISPRLNAEQFSVQPPPPRTTTRVSKEYVNI